MRLNKKLFELQSSWEPKGVMRVQPVGLHCFQTLNPEVLFQVKITWITAFQNSEGVTLIEPPWVPQAMLEVKVKTQGMVIINI